MLTYDSVMRFIAMIYLTLIDTWIDLQNAFVQSHIDRKCKEITSTHAPQLVAAFSCDLNITREVQLFYENSTPGAFQLIRWMKNNFNRDIEVIEFYFSQPNTTQLRYAIIDLQKELDLRTNKEVSGIAIEDLKLTLVGVPGMAD